MKTSGAWRLNVWLGVAAVFCGAAVCQPVHDWADELVLQSSPWRETTKAGMVPAERWDNVTFPREAFWDWQRRHAGNETRPLADRCAVFVNHHYK